MSEEAPLDLHGLADIDEPEVVRAALRAFRRRLWTRYLWIGLAIVLGALALVVGNRPSNLREEMEAANIRSFPAEAVWRVDGLSIALVEAADLGDSLGLHFIALPDRGSKSSIWVVGSTYGMGWGDYDTYTKTGKSSDGIVDVLVGRSGCLPFCPEQQKVTLDMRELGVPTSVWRVDHEEPGPQPP